MAGRQGAPQRGAQGAAEATAVGADLALRKTYGRPMWSYGEMNIPSGILLHSYWKWPFIVSFPIKNGDFP